MSSVSVTPFNQGIVVTPSGEFFIVAINKLIHRDGTSESVTVRPDGYLYFFPSSGVYSPVFVSDDDVSVYAGSLRYNTKLIGGINVVVLAKGETFDSSGTRVPITISQPPSSEIQSIVSVEELSETVQSSYAVVTSIVLIFLGVIVFRWAKRLLKNAVNSAG